MKHQIIVLVLGIWIGKALAADQSAAPSVRSAWATPPSGGAGLPSGDLQVMRAISHSVLAAKRIQSEPPEAAQLRERVASLSARVDELLGAAMATPTANFGERKVVARSVRSEVRQVRNADTIVATKVSTGAGAVLPQVPPQSATATPTNDMAAMTAMSSNNENQDRTRERPAALDDRKLQAVRIAARDAGDARQRLELAAQRPGALARGDHGTQTQVAAARVALLEAELDASLAAPEGERFERLKRLSRRLRLVSAPTLLRRTADEARQSTSDGVGSALADRALLGAPGSDDDRLQPQPSWTATKHR